MVEHLRAIKAKEEAAAAAAAKSGAEKEIATTKVTVAADVHG